MSSDSDDSFIEAKKSKSTGVRARRGFSKKLTDVSTISASSSIYSSRAAQCFKDIGDHKVQITVPIGTDVESDVVVGRLKKSHSAPATTRCDVLFLSDDDEDENCKNIQNTPTGKGPDGMVILSPTPPDSPPAPPDNPSSRGRKKRGGRRGKQHKQLAQAVSNITKNVSDAERLLKASRGQFDTPDKDVCILEVDDELTIRIEHRDRIQRYQLQSDEHFSAIVTQIADREGVPTRCVMLVYNDHTLRPTDTPQSIQFRAGDIIACHIVANADESFTADGDEDNLIELVLQRQGSRQRELMKAHKHETLSVLIDKYASMMEEQASSLQVYFDGDYVHLTSTPTDLEMEHGDILDVKVIT